MTETTTTAALYPGTPGLLLCQAFDANDQQHVYVVLYAGSISSSNNGSAYKTGWGCPYVGLARLSDLANAGFNPYDYVVYVNQVGVSPHPQDDTGVVPITTTSPLQFTMNDPTIPCAFQMSIDATEYDDGIGNGQALTWAPMPGSIQNPETNIQAKPTDPTVTIPTAFYLVPSNYQSNASNTLGTNLCPFQTSYALVGAFGYEGETYTCAFTWSWDSSGRATLAAQNTVPSLPGQPNSPNWTDLNIPGNTPSGPNYFVFGFLPVYQLLSPCMCSSSAPCGTIYAPFAPGSPWLSLMTQDDSVLQVPNYDGTNTLILNEGGCAFVEADSNDSALYVYYPSELCQFNCSSCVDAPSSTDVLGAGKRRFASKRRRRKRASVWLPVVIAVSVALVLGLCVFAIAYVAKPASIANKRAD